MRRAIGLTALLLPVLIAIARMSEGSVFLKESYGRLLEIPYMTAEIIIYQAILLGVLITLMELTRRQHGLPVEAHIVLAASPAYILLLVRSGEALLLGILALAIAYAWRNQHAITILALAAAVVHPAGIILGIIVLATALTRKHIAHASILFVGLLALILSTTPTYTFALRFSEIGHLGGTSMFILLIALTGIIMFWKKTTYPYLLATTAVIAAGLLIQELALAGAIAAAFIGGKALELLQKREWSLQSIRNISVLLVACGLLFAAVSTAAQGVRAEPRDIYDTLDFLADLEAEEIFMLAEHEDLFTYYGISTTSQNQEQILAARNVDEILPLLPRYFILHEEDKVDNLRFLIENTDNFVEVQEGRYSVWVFRN